MRRPGKTGLPTHRRPPAKGLPTHRRPPVKRNESEAADPVEETSPVPTRPKRRGLRRILPAPFWQIGRLLLLALIIEYLVVPQLAGPRKVAHLITEVNPLLLLAGVALEAASLFSYAQLARSVLPEGRKLSLSTILRVQLTTLSVSHCAPGGTATGAALGYRLLTQAGHRTGRRRIRARSAGHRVRGGPERHPVGGAHRLDPGVGVLCGVPHGRGGRSGASAGGRGPGRHLHPRRGAEWGRCWRRPPRGSRSSTAPLSGVRSSTWPGGSKKPSRQRRVLLQALIWATANWLFDAASLAVFVGAFGHWVNPDGLLVAYGLANVLAAIPITPGGLGVVEAALTTLLVGFGTPRGVAALGVVAYRLDQLLAADPARRIVLSLASGGLGAAGTSGETGLQVARSRLAAPFRWPWRRMSQKTPGA